MFASLAAQRLRFMLIWFLEKLEVFCLADFGQLAGKVILKIFCSFLVLYLMIPCLQMNK